MCTLKDHYSTDATFSARHIEQLLKHEQAEKSQRLKHFQEMEKYRAKFHVLLTKSFKAEYMAKKLSGADLRPPSQQLSKAHPMDSSGRGSVQILINPELSTNIETTPQSIDRPSDILSICPNPLQNLLPSLTDPILIWQARQLSLHGWPHLIRRAYHQASLLGERDAAPLRQAAGRHVYSLAERRRVRWLREQTEASRAAEQLKAKAEQRFELQHGSTARANTPTLKANDVQTEANLSCSRATCNHSKIQHNHDFSSNVQKHSEQLTPDVVEPELDYLLERLMKQLDGKLPKLCLCPQPSSGLMRAESIQKPWSNCANNCPFYGRPEGYLKALLDFVSSMDYPHRRTFHHYETMDSKH